MGLLEGFYKAMESLTKMAERMRDYMETTNGADEFKKKGVL